MRNGRGTKEAVLPKKKVVAARKLKDWTKFTTQIKRKQFFSAFPAGRGKLDQDGYEEGFAVDLSSTSRYSLTTLPDQSKDPAGIRKENSQNLYKPRSRNGFTS